MKTILTISLIISAYLLTVSCGGPNGLQKLAAAGDITGLVQALSDGQTNNLWRQDGRGYSLFHYAVLAPSNNKEILSLLNDFIYTHRISISNLTDNEGRTPLHYALAVSSKDNRYCAYELLNMFNIAGYNLTNISDKNGRNPLLYAIENGFFESIPSGLATTADLTVKTGKGLAVWEILALESPRSLIPYATTPDEVYVNTLTRLTNAAGETLLHLAARYDQTDLALFCLRILVNDRSREEFLALPRDAAGRHPLHTAAENGAILFFNFLNNEINGGISTDELYWKNMTPLAVAVKTTNALSAFAIVNNGMGSLDALGTNGEPIFKKADALSNDNELMQMSPYEKLLYLYYPFTVMPDAGSVNLRESPVDGTVLTAVKAREEVRIIDIPDTQTTNINNRRGAWLKVEYKGQRGYLFSGYLLDNRVPDLFKAYKACFAGVPDKQKDVFSPVFFELLMQDGELKAFDELLSVQLFLSYDNLWPSFQRSYQDVSYYFIKTVTPNADGAALSVIDRYGIKEMILSGDSASWSGSTNSYVNRVFKNDYKAWKYPDNY